MFQMEENLERERRAKAEMEKARRKVELDLRASNEQIEELNRIRIEQDVAIKKLVFVTL